MTFIQGRGRPRQESTSEGLLGSLLPPESSHDEAPVKLSAEPLIAKYIEKDLQKIFRTVFEAQAPSSDGPHEKPMKARLSDVYCGKSHMEHYNFC